MKLTTTILILSVCFCGYGQVTSVTGRLGSVDEYDTSRCVMLICDTSVFNATWIGYSILPIHNESLFWLYGYKVTSKHRTGEIEYSHEDGKWIPYPVYDYDFVNYLDADKKPLSKSIIVWQTKELK